MPVKSLLKEYQQLTAPVIENTPFLDFIYASFHAVDDLLV